MPWRSESMGVGSVTGVPSISIAPSSMVTSPPRIFIRVDFPAPLAPRSATASPAPTASSARLSASTPGKRLVMPCSLRQGIVISSPLPAKAIKRHETDDDRAADHLIDIEADLGRIERIVEKRDEERTEYGAPELPGPTKDTDATDDAGADDIEHHRCTRQV